MSPYETSLRWLYGLEIRGVRLELDRMRAALALRAHPERGAPGRALRYVHIAGTNGKGSVSAMVEAALRAAGLRTGLFTSPHLHRFVERVRIAGRPLTEAAAARGIAALRRDRRLPDLTFFEHAALLAFESFKEAACDLVVLEVGLGGRLDATNVIDPEVCVITSIGRDHCRILGDTLPAIAREKAGILKEGVPLILGARGAPARRAIRARARRLEVPMRAIDRDFGAEARGSRVDLFAGDARLEGARLSLEGPHQLDNAACAFATLVALRERGFALPDAAILEGLQGARWPGRMERIPGAPEHLLDCAHNPQGSQALAAALRRIPRRGRRVLLFGALGDKDHEGLLAPLDGLFDDLFFASPKIRRAVDPARFAAIRPGRVCRSIQDGLARARRRAGAEGLVVVAGSLFTVAAARALLLGVRSDPPISL